MLSLINGTDPHAIGRLRREFVSTRTNGEDRKVDLRRSGAQLLAAAEVKRAEREEHERELAQRARAKKEAAAKAARDLYLNDLEKREEQIWGNIDVLISSKLPKNYDESVSLLRDLHDLADRHGSKTKFAAHLRHIIDRHLKKPSLIQRIQRAGLMAI